VRFVVVLGILIVVRLIFQSPLGLFIGGLSQGFMLPFFGLFVSQASGWSRRWFVDESHKAGYWS